MNAPFRVEEIAAHYRALADRVPLRPLRTKRLGRAVECLDSLVDRGGADQTILSPASSV